MFHLFQPSQLSPKACQPVASCRVMRDADHVCCCAGPRDNDERLFVGVINVFNRVAIFSIDLGHIFGANQMATNQNVPIVH